MGGEPGLQGTVAAILVAHDGAAWLPKVLTSLSTMDLAPIAWHAVDVSSTDSSAHYLRQSFGASRISFAAAGTSFGEAVALALEHVPRTEWLWLLHDDAIATPTTLSGLLHEANSSPDIAVVGPKIREWPSLMRLLEVGVTVTGTGHRITNLETGEPDAGQHDRPVSVLAVSSAGMLVRRDVWDALGGFDANLPMYFDDIDFGWRVTRFGHRVRTAPRGVMFHAEASARASRPRSAGDVPTWDRRRAAIYTVLANADRWRFPLLYVRLFFGSLLRVVGFLFDRDPEAAGDELLAVRDVYFRRGVLREARRARAPFALRPHAEIKKLLPPWWLPYRQGLDALREAIAGVVKPETVETVGRRSVLGDQSPDEADDLDDGPSMVRRRPWFSTVVVLVLASIVAGRGLIGGDLHGLALPPAPDTAGGWWSLVFGRSHDAGIGSTAFGPTFALILGALATPLWWWPGLLVKAAVLFSVPLAAMTAHRLGRAFLPDRPVRVGWAITYALLVVASGAVAQGRIGTIVALIVAPIIVNTLLQLATEPGWQVGLRLGIWVAVAASFAPVAFWLSMVGLAAVVLWSGIRRPAVIAVGVAVVLLGPWFFQRVIHPLRLWWEAGHPVPGHASLADMALGSGGGPGTAPIAVSAIVVALAVCALVPPATRPQVWLAWLVALGALAVGVLGLAVTYSTPAGQDGITAWVGLCATVWVGALAAAVAIAVPEAESQTRPVAITVVLAALVVPIGLGAWWLTRGVADPLTVEKPDLVPAYLAVQGGRTAVVTGTVAAGVEVRVVAADGPYLGEEAVARNGAIAADAVSDLFGSPYGDGAAELARHGIDAVYAPDADPVLESRLDAVPSFAPAGADEPGSRVWLVTGDVQPEPTPSAGFWRWAVGAGQVIAWLSAIILTAPVRRREQPGELVDDAPFLGEIRPVAQ